MTPILGPTAVGYGSMKKGLCCLSKLSISVPRGLELRLAAPPGKESYGGLRVKTPLGSSRRGAVVNESD